MAWIIGYLYWESWIPSLHHSLLSSKYINNEYLMYTYMQLYTNYIVKAFFRIYNVVHPILKSVSTQLNNFGAHTSTLVADVSSSVSQVDLAGRERAAESSMIDSPSCCNFKPYLVSKKLCFNETYKFVYIWGVSLTKSDLKNEHVWSPKLRFGRWFSCSIRWFLGSMLIFRSVYNCGKWRILWWLHPRTGTHPVCNLKRDHPGLSKSKKQHDRFSKDACKDTFHRKNIFSNTKLSVGQKVSYNYYRT